MVLVRPITATVISSSEFGQPVNDYIAANTPSIWMPVDYLNGWADSGVAFVEYRTIGTIAYLRGRMTGGAIGSPAFQLPIGVRPPALIDHPTACYDTGVWSFAFGTIDTGGFYLPVEGANAAWSVNVSYATA